MQARREFLKKALGFLTGAMLLFSPALSGVRSALARTKRIILPRNTKRESLITRNPAELDTRNLEITPLHEFKTMGITDHRVDLERWRLQVTGCVKKPLRLSRAEILDLPSIERNVLLICPGVFVNHGRWKGISIADLLRRAGAEKGAAQVTLHGPEGDYEKTETFTMEEVSSNKVFLAYAVNGKGLPQKHGFPLRAVAEDHYGFDWVKYVYKVTADMCGG
jgi:sulfoxide reductase catalytic subunit YedY